MAQAIITPSRRLLVGPRGFRKPARPVLDVTDPINRGRVACFPFGGDPLQNLAGARGTLHGTGITRAPSHHSGVSAQLTTSSADYISAPIGRLPVGAAIRTMGVWLYAISNGGTNVYCGYGADSQLLNWGLYSSGASLFLWMSGGQDAPILSGTFNAGVWYHAIADFDGTNVSAFVNGVSALAATPRALNTGTTNVCVAGGGAYGFSCNGRVDGLSHFNRLLTTAEKLRLYAEPYAGIYEEGPRFAELVGAAAVAATILNRRTLGPRVGSRSVY